MKKLIAILALLPLCSFAQVTTISQYPNKVTVPDNYLLLYAQPGVTNWNQNLAQFKTQLNSELNFVNWVYNFSSKFSLSGSNVTLAASAVATTNLDSSVTNWVNTTATNVATSLANTAQTNAINAALQTATNAFVLQGLSAVTNGSTIWLQTTNFNIVNSNYIYIAAVTNAQGKLFVSSNNVWFTK